jgi:K+-transporting ATPase ATPase B chain
LTLLFANFAEAIAEARGKAQAESLRKTREETPAKLLKNDQIQSVSSSSLTKGDIFICEAGDIIPSDGEIIEGLATIDESAITGESAPVIREAGGDKSSVTGGTKVLSDKIKVRVTTQPGESFLDKMIALVEGASRQKSPNEIALTILLAGFTLIFIIVCVSLKPFADYANTPITIAAYISLFMFDSNYHWRTFISHWYRRDGQSFACQCDYQVGESRRNSGRYRCFIIGQNRYYYYW